MIKVALQIRWYFYSIPQCSLIFLDEENRLTGKWRIIDEELLVQIERTELNERLFFKPKKEKKLYWYPSEDIKFIYEGCCNDK